MDQRPLLDAHFSIKAFCFSAIALLILAPLSLILGTAAGFALHSALGSKMDKKDPALTDGHTICACLAATAALIGWTPAAFLWGGPILSWTPALLSAAFGHAAFRYTV